MQLVILLFFIIIVSCSPKSYKKNAIDDLNENKAKTNISISNSSGLVIND